MSAHYPIRIGAAPAGNPADYGDLDAIRALLDATDPGAVKAAGDAYKAASQHIEGFKALLVRASRTLSEVWEDEAAATAQRMLRKLQISAENLAIATGQIGTALDWHGGEILPWYVAHKPGSGWFKDDGDDEYAREYMQRLNTRIAEAWTRLPASVTTEPAIMDRGTPEGLVSSGTARGGNAVVPPDRGATGGFAAVNEAGTVGSEQRPPLAGPAVAHAEAGRSETGGVHPAAWSRDAPGGAFGSGRTELAGAETGGPANSQAAFGNAGGRPAQFAPAAPGQFAPANGPVPPPGFGAPAGGLGAPSPRPGPLNSPAGSAGGRAGISPGRGGAPGGAPTSVPSTNGGPAGGGRTSARSMPLSPAGGPGAGGAGRREDERDRRYWLAEDRDLWKAEEDAVASVIGTSSSADDATEGGAGFADESTEIWSADSTPEHVLGHLPSPSAAVEPQDGQATACACGCACGGSENDGEVDARKAEGRGVQGPPGRLEASPILRGE
ncbi:hypothetical protein [Actinomadura rifamycini]|uniref:hypothetical protein n=1 Tax=Actinomadura rifamycini TaxID=31962 RepID=UPI00040054B5|nr:hypothetical protein [Actinomadura rifamycini]